MVVQKQIVAIRFSTETEYRSLPQVAGIWLTTTGWNSFGILNNCLGKRIDRDFV